jgi:DNA-binding CsgD family transcriptional regulator
VGTARTRAAAETSSSPRPRSLVQSSDVSPVGPPPVIHGRIAEQDAIDLMLAAARAGSSGALVIWGGTGSGKTLLLDLAARSAVGIRVERISGVEAERELPFAAVHQLVRGMLDGAEALPLPQRQALNAAFGLGRDAPPDRFLVSLAVLGLLSNASAEQPLLCIVDDAHWLDRRSAETLVFAARRSGTGAISFVFAAEPTEAATALDTLPELRLAGLSDEEAGEVLAAAVAGAINRLVRDRVIAEAGGNPLALQQLAAALTPSQLNGRSVLPERLTLGARLEHRLVRLVLELPPQTQLLLLLLSADPGGDEGLLARAATALRVGPEAAGPAEGGELLEAGRLVFRHPFVASALYRAAGALERSKVHEALAAAADPETDPDWRAWHRAASVLGPDEDVAAELERAAPRALAREGHALAARFLEHSARLTPDPGRRSERTLEAVRHLLMSGATGRAWALLADASLYVHDERQRVQAERLRGAISLERGRGGTAPDVLLQAALTLEPLDVPLARETHLEALIQSLYSGPLVSGDLLRKIASAGRAAPRPVGAATVADEILDSFAALFTEGHAAAAEGLRSVVERLRLGEGDDDLRTLGYGCHAAMETWDDEAVHVIATRRLQRARDTGALTELPRALSYMAHCEVLFGRFDVAIELVDEAGAVTAATRNPGIVDRANAVRLIVSAWQGREEEARTLAEDGIREAVARGHGAEINLAQYALSVLENGLGRPAAALVAARVAFELKTIYVTTAVTPELIEAAVRSGEPHLAAPALARLTESALAGGTEWGLGMLARSRALLAEGAAAEELYLAAIEHLSRCRARVHLARARLLYGEWLRRSRRPREARDQLRTAYDMCSSMRAAGFAERARTDLLATGEHRVSRTAQSVELLTPHELRIARLASEGASNGEIAAALFVSRRTVEYHLHKIYRKLDIGSRTQLARKLVELGE